MAPGISPPPDGHKGYQDLLKQVVSSLGVQTEVVKEVTHGLLDSLSQAGPSRVALLLHDAIMDPIKALWQTPASLPLMAKCSEHKYFVPAKGCEFLFSTPIPLGIIGGCGTQ